MFMVNLENRGNLLLSAVNTPSMTFHAQAKRIFVGGTSGLIQSDDFASFNIRHTNDNGLYVRAHKLEHYGIRIEALEKQIGLEIMQKTDQGYQRNFCVTGEGYVFARRYTPASKDL